MKCPNCGVAGPAGAVECAACGVIIAKFKKKLVSLEPPPPVKINLWIGRVIAFALVVAWMAALVIYFQIRPVLRPLPRRGTGTMQVPPPDAH